MKSILTEQPRGPKGGMEIGILSIAMLLALIFASTRYFSSEEGFHVLPKAHTEFPVEEDIHEIFITDRNEIRFRDSFYNMNEFKKEFLMNVYIPGDYCRVSMVKTVPFGEFIKFRDDLVLEGIPEGKIAIGGTVKDVWH